MKRPRPDLETVVDFLTTRASKSDVDDWEKLRRVLRFVHCTLEGKRAFGATNLNEIFTWVDASYAIHNDMQGALFHRFRDIIMVRVSTYTLLKDITSYSSKERVKNQIPGKQIPPKKQIPSKEPKRIEDGKGKELRT